MRGTVSYLFVGRTSPVKVLSVTVGQPRLPDWWHASFLGLRCAALVISPWLPVLPSQAGHDIDNLRKKLSKRNAQENMSDSVALEND